MLFSKSSSTSISTKPSMLGNTNNNVVCENTILDETELLVISTHTILLLTKSIKYTAVKKVWKDSHMVGCQSHGRLSIQTSTTTHVMLKSSLLYLVHFYWSAGHPNRGPIITPILDMPTCAAYSGGDRSVIDSDQCTLPLLEDSWSCWHPSWQVRSVFESIIPTKAASYSYQSSLVLPTNRLTDCTRRLWPLGALTSLHLVSGGI